MFATSSASSLHKDHPGRRITKIRVSLLSNICSAIVDDDGTTFPCLTRLSDAFFIKSNMIDFVVAVVVIVVCCL